MISSLRRNLAYERGRPLIVGDGIMGLMTAFFLSQEGIQPQLLSSGETSTSWQAGGMLAPVCEQLIADPVIGALGFRSLRHWREDLAPWHEVVGFAAHGSLIVAHPRDRSLWLEFRARLADLKLDHYARITNTTGLHTLEPALAPGFQEGLYLPDEAHVDPRRLLSHLREILMARGITMTRQAVPLVTPQPMGQANMDPAFLSQFPLVIDCRGLGAGRPLRGVRGEALLLHAPELPLQRPVRLLHPRHPLYLVPRANGHLYVGATQIESEDDSPVSVRSALELLSATMVLNPQLGEARVVETITGLRPAYPDNRPAISVGHRYLQINGLFRHGYMISPALAALAARFVAKGQVEAAFTTLFVKQEENSHAS